LGNEFQRTIKELDQAITNHVQVHKGSGRVITGWMVLASVADSENLERDNYVMQSSPALAHHSQVGMLQVALDDKRNIGLIATLGAMMGDDEE